ncbi:MAG: hypothetical protein A3F46_06105 [Legionellales bacterium RIFCSPHIGHO2_12_FULL_42_9]|nr:MAG: hypothetical protein A3F46_06105 [Legionellales bacterium RIFCSPHIGHO2_12_FULL_42_9]
MTLDYNLAEKITTLHDQCIVHWKISGVVLEATDFYALVEQNHSWNFQLWLAEDRARREDKGFEFVYNAKREIDRFNQQRNNVMEAMDEWLFKQLKPSQDAHCPLHSETPGMIIDRLSIMALKVYHMNLQVLRQDVPEEHRKLCESKRHVLKAQRGDLNQCLDNLLNEIKLKQRTFRVYHQFKMYNDPELNPELYCPQGLSSQP